MNLFISIILMFCIVNAESIRTFPKNFSFGTGSSAYQTEGSWNQDGKSENIWDHWIHSDPTRIKGNATADVAAGFYISPILEAYYPSTIDVQHYSFSIPWSRILPTGFLDQINMKAITHYEELISQLQFHNIKPLVTLYYHDLPQSLQDIGGWTNPAMAKYFADYARICFQFFGSKVERFITFNDPMATCRRGYGEGTFAPGIKSDGVGEYLCAYTVLRAHAAAYHVYKEEFKDLKGKISMAIDMKWSEPASDKDKDVVERRNAFEFGLYADPIYKGNWPKEVIDRIDYRSKNENYSASRLPKFTEEEISYINGTSDFMAVNLFSANMVKDNQEAEFDDTSFANDMKAKAYLNSNWNLAVSLQPIVPWSARKTLAWLKSSYNNPEIFITANGVADNDGRYDYGRIDYITDYLNAILDAIEQDEVKVTGYTAWSLCDSFQWTDGYSYQYGLYSVDFKGSSLSMGDKYSLRVYRSIAATFIIPEATTTTTPSTTTSTTTMSVPQTTPGFGTKITLCPLLILIVLYIFHIF